MNNQDRKELLEFKLEMVQKELRQINQCIFVLDPRIQELTEEMRKIKNELAELEGGQGDGEKNK
ncbi:MAG: hypothetical protein LUC37_04080 [Prevotella sp.]|nr:hypothetical protein [Prevotella sp.]